MQRAWILGMLLIIVACSQASKEIYYFEGSVMGTTYHIKVSAYEPPDANSIDSVLFYVDTLLTTYSNQSELMRVNWSDPGTLLVSQDFAYVFKIARTIWKESKGAFDPTVGPLAWKHGFGPKISLDTIITGFEYFKLIETETGYFLIKEKANVFIDFGGIAKGYGVDKLAWFLLQKGYTDFMIEVGGEVRISGFKPDGNHWKIGIENPFKEGKFIYVVSDTNISIATSGTYRQKRKKGKTEITHIVSTHNQYSLTPDVVLASFMDTSCTYADGWATALVAMGCDSAKVTIIKQKFQNAIVICQDSTALFRINGNVQNMDKSL